MADFSRYGGVSDEWQAVDKDVTTEFLSPDSSPVQIRQLMNARRQAASAKAMDETFHDHVLVHNYTISTRDGSVIGARSYRPVSAGRQDRLPVFLYLHGGGFVMGSLDTEDATCSRICLDATAVVLHVNYRHTPEHVYPTAWDDAEDGFVWLHQNVDLLGGNPEQVIVGGISAGAQLAASLVLRKNMGKVLSGYPAIAGQVLIVPCLVHPDTYEPQLKKLKDASKSSYKENEDAPLLPVRVVRIFASLLQTGTPDPLDFRLSPGNASVEEVRGLPPTTFGIAGLDPLRDEALLYSELLAEAGVPTDTYVFPGMPHGFRLFTQACQSKRWDAILAHGVTWALSKPEPSASVVKTEGP
ncbi:hypothetical protein E4U42_000438 [Claviceps africana]|uniref:Alpha/beta hydrolase fold-3 domain-containing protein n=1 Tax=Claviceps africana TaxID=83212 RepID=A0A8K0J2J1_9HYPO|nr:hypothetical protein E4U42_000438 [Claviceps africana]